MLLVDYQDCILSCVCVCVETNERLLEPAHTVSHTSYSEYYPNYCKIALTVISLIWHLQQLLIQFHQQTFEYFHTNFPSSALQCNVSFGSKTDFGWIRSTMCAQCSILTRTHSITSITSICKTNESRSFRWHQMSIIYYCLLCWCCCGCGCCHGSSLYFIPIHIRISAHPSLISVI